MSVSLIKKAEPIGFLNEMLKPESREKLMRDGYNMTDTMQESEIEQTK